MKKRLKLLFLLMNISMACMSFTLDGIEWISVPTELQKSNQWICFRKNFNVDEIPDSVPMAIAVDSKYWLWVNGKLAVFEGGLKRGPNPQDTYYDVVDISEFLKKGDNCVAVLMWYWGKDGFCHKSSGRSGLLSKIFLGNKSIVTDSTWKVCIHDAFGETGDPRPNYRLPESNVHFDARRDIGNWTDKGYDDSSWENASVAGKYPCSPWNRLHRRPFPNWKDSGILKYDNIRVENIGEGMRKVICSLPKNISVTPYMKVKSVAGCLIDIRSDNYKGGSEYNVRAEYVTKDGVQEFEMPNYINGHKIIYTLPEGVEFVKLGYRYTGFNTEHVGRFSCDDSFYDKLWVKSLNTMNLNMRDAIQDPDRERSQWWGDAAIILHEIFYSCDVNGHAAVKKAIMNLVDWQKEDGVLYSPVPAGSWDKELPLQMLASIGKYGFWSYYWYTADTAAVRYVMPAVKKYLSLWKLDSDGLVVHRSGGWDWADWGNEIDVPVLENAWFCLALEGAAGMASVIGDKEYSDWCRSVGLKVKNASVKKFWDGSSFRSPERTLLLDDRANALALLAGFADSEEQKMKICDLLMSREKASPYMEKYVSEALFKNGFTEEALYRMKKRYGNMVNSNLTTLWEDWAIGGAGGGSINHGWAGSPLQLLSQFVAGVSPLAPGWDVILVRPSLGNLKEVECRVPVCGAYIDVKVRDDAERWSLEVDNKSGKDCVVAVPEAYADDISLKKLSSFDTKDIPECGRTGFVYFKMIGNKIRLSARK